MSTTSTITDNTSIKNPELKTKSIRNFKTFLAPSQTTFNRQLNNSQDKNKILNKQLKKIYGYQGDLTNENVEIDMSGMTYLALQGTIQKRNILPLYDDHRKSLNTIQKIEDINIKNILTQEITNAIQNLQINQSLYENRDNSIIGLVNIENKYDYLGLDQIYNANAIYLKLIEDKLIKTSEIKKINSDELRAILNQYKSTAYEISNNFDFKQYQNLDKINQELNNTLDTTIINNPTKEQTIPINFTTKAGAKIGQENEKILDKLRGNSINSTPETLTTSKPNKNYLHTEDFNNQMRQQFDDYSKLNIIEKYRIADKFTPELKDSLEKINEYSKEFGKANKRINDLEQIAEKINELEEKINNLETQDINISNDDQLQRWVKNNPEGKKFFSDLKQITESIRPLIKSINDPNLYKTLSAENIQSKLIGKGKFKGGDIIQTLNTAKEKINNVIEDNKKEIQNSFSQNPEALNSIQNDLKKIADLTRVNRINAIEIEELKKNNLTIHKNDPKQIENNNNVINLNQEVIQHNKDHIKQLSESIKSNLNQLKLNTNIENKTNALKAINKDLKQANGENKGLWGKFKNSLNFELSARMQKSLTLDKLNPLISETNKLKLQNLSRQVCNAIGSKVIVPIEKFFIAVFNAVKKFAKEKIFEPVKEFIGSTNQKINDIYGKFGNYLTSKGNKIKTSSEKKEKKFLIEQLNNLIFSDKAIKDNDTKILDIKKLIEKLAPNEKNSVQEQLNHIKELLNQPESEKIKGKANLEKVISIIEEELNKNPELNPNLSRQESTTSISSERSNSPLIKENSSETNLNISDFLKNLETKIINKQKFPEESQSQTNTYIHTF